MEEINAQKSQLTPQKQDDLFNDSVGQKTKLIFLNIGIVCMLVFNFLSEPEVVTEYGTSYKKSVPPTKTENYYSVESQASTVQEDVQENAPTFQESEEEDFAWLSNQRLEASDLYKYSSSELRLLRNAIYARHGYRFKSTDLQEYFSQFSWYTPSTNDVSYSLTAIENENIMLIKSLE